MVLLCKPAASLYIAHLTAIAYEPLPKTVFLLSLKRAHIKWLQSEQRTVALLACTPAPILCMAQQ